MLVAAFLRVPVALVFRIGGGLGRPAGRAALLAGRPDDLGDAFVVRPLDVLFGRFVERLVVDLVGLIR